MHLHSLFRLTDGYVYWQDAAWWGAHVLDLNPERLAHSDCHVLIPDSFQLILSCSKHGVLNVLRAPQYSFLSINFQVNMHETLPVNMHETLPAVYCNDSTIGFRLIFYINFVSQLWRKIRRKARKDFAWVTMLHFVTKLISKNACYLCYCQHPHWRARMIQDEEGLASRTEDTQSYQTFLVMSW